MRAKEFIPLYERSAVTLGIHEIIDIADNELSGGAARAITSFIGHEPGTIDKMASSDYDDPMAGFGIMGADDLESGKYAKEIEHAFEPVRAKLKDMLGDSIILYRLQYPIEDGKKERNYLSWTSDSKFVDDYAGVSRRNTKLISEADIVKAEKEFEQNGEVKIPTTDYTLKLEHLVARTGKNVDYIMIYQGNEDITDTDSVRKFIEGINKDRAEFDAENQKKREKIITANVSLDDVIWVSDRAGQSEFIVRNDSASSAYINAKGALVK